ELEMVVRRAAEVSVASNFPDGIGVRRLHCGSERAVLSVREGASPVSLPRARSSMRAKRLHEVSQGRPRDGTAWKRRRGCIQSASPPPWPPDDTKGGTMSRWLAYLVAA